MASDELEMLRMGVAALQAGNRQNAINLLKQVVDLNPQNEQAWFYLAAADTDMNNRKRYLQRVLDINPGNKKAWDILEKLVAKDQSPTAPPPTTRPAPPPVPTPLISDDPLGSVIQPPNPADPVPTLSWDAPSSTPLSWEAYGSTTQQQHDEADDMPDPDSFAPIQRKTAAKTLPPVDENAQPEDIFTAFDANAPKAADQKVTYKTIRPLAPDAGSLLGAAPSDKGIALPLDIPGAPARVSLMSFGQGGFTLLRGSIRILTRRQNAFHTEIDRASWWRFWVYAIFTAAIQTILLAITLWMIDGRITAEAAATGRVVNFASGLVMLLLGIPFYVGTLAAGAGIGWFGMRTVLKLKPPFLTHLYSVAIVWLPINLLFTVIGFVFNLLNLVPIWHYSLLAILTAIGLSVLAAFLLYDALRHFEGEIMTDQKERRKRRLIAALNVIGIFASRLLLGLLLGAITGASLLIYLFA